MKIAAIIIVILGSLLTAGLGANWIIDYNDSKEELAFLSETAGEFGIDASREMEEIEKIKNCGYVLVACGFIAIVSVFLNRKLRKISAAIIVVSGILPVIFTPETLIFTFLLILGGILAFFIKPKTKTA